jgi:hypothetical protein
MKARRDAFISLGLLLVLVLIAVGSGIRESQNAEKPPYSSLSTAPNGTSALRAWLESMDAEILPEALPAFEPPETARLIFMLEPFNVTEDEIVLLDDWVRRGNTLVAAGTRQGIRLLAEYYGFSLYIASETTRQAAFQNPLLASPQSNTAIPTNTRFALSASHTNYVTYLGNQAHPVLVSFQRGRGRVILSSAPYLFSNQGLTEEGMPEVVLNVLRLAGTDGPAWFDEWHHGLRSQAEITGPGQWLAGTPIGHALLFIAATVFISLLLQGRGFGRPLTPLREIRRRAPLEYIRAIANLGRRAGHRRHVMGQYHTALKRGLGKRYRLDPSTPDVEYVEALANYKPDIDKQALLDLLTSLDSGKAGESEMVRLAADTAEWLKNT